MTEIVSFISCEIILEFILDEILNMLNKFWDFYIREQKKMNVS